MKLTTAVFVALVVVVTVANCQTLTSPSPCAASLGVGKPFNTSGQFLGAVINGIANVIGSPTSIFRPYFNGSIPAGSTNFFAANSSAFQTLANHLITFFNLALNCTDGTVGNYTGRTMAQVHGPIPIDLGLYNSFNLAIYSNLGLNGMSASDVNRVRGILGLIRGQICNTGGCLTPSPCDGASARQGNANFVWLQRVVVQTFTAAIGGSLRKFFDGSLPNTRDFINNANNQAQLVDHLVTFFGEPTTGPLGCSDGSISLYTGVRNMQTVHQFLPIGLDDFNGFNSALLTVLSNNGANTAEAAVASGYLESTKSAICNQPSCNAGPPSSASTISFLAPLSAFLVALNLIFF